MSYTAYPGQSVPWTHHSSRSYSAGSIYYPPRSASPSPSKVNGYHPRSRSVSGNDSFRSSPIPMSSTTAPAGSVPDRYHRHRPSLRSSPSVKSFDFDSTSTQTSNTSSSGSIPDETSKQTNIQQVRDVLNRPSVQSMPDLTLPKARSNSPTKTPVPVDSITPPSSVSGPTAAFQPIQPKWARAPSPPDPVTQPPARRQPAKQGPLVLPSDMRVRHSVSMVDLPSDEKNTKPMVRQSEPTSRRSPSVEALRGPPVVAMPAPRPHSMYTNYSLTPEISPKTSIQNDAETRSLQPGRGPVRPTQPQRPASVLGVIGEAKAVANARSQGPAPAPAPVHADAQAKQTLKKSRSFGDRLRSLFGSGKSTTNSSSAKSQAAVKPARQPSRTGTQSSQELKSDAASMTSVKSSMSTLSMSSMRTMFKRKDKKVPSSPSFEVLTRPMSAQEQQQHVESQLRHQLRDHKGSQPKIDYTPRSYRNSLGVSRPVSVSSINSLSDRQGGSVSRIPSAVETEESLARPVSMAFGDALSPETPEVAIFSDGVEDTRTPTPLPTLADDQAESDDDGVDLSTASSTVFPKSLDAEGVANILSSLDVPHRELSRKSSRRSNRSAKEREEESVPDPQEIYVGSTPEDLKSLETFSFPSTLDSLDLFHPALDTEPFNFRGVYEHAGSRTRSSLRKGSRSGPRRQKVSFSSRIVVFDTYAETDYDRTPEEATCHRLSTPGLAHQIKQELNSFKVQMEVHEQSRAYTHYFRD